ncbi:hypothetical protein [Paenibacillus andongensis]|uniref:hypothetical protein n=1 Tax=Paenibacillus andongensis TaxID=2975482 RepID=UPI0021BA5FC2|nr:hypothetical protein [Paenibacillus andongensis]
MEEILNRRMEASKKGAPRYDGFVDGVVTQYHQGGALIMKFKQTDGQINVLNELPLLILLWVSTLRRKLMSHKRLIFAASYFLIVFSHSQIQLKDSKN